MSVRSISFVLGRLEVGKEKGEGRSKGMSRARRGGVASYIYGESLIGLWETTGSTGDLVSLSLGATIGGRLGFYFSTTKKRFCPGRWGQGVGRIDAIAYYTSTKKQDTRLADGSQLEQAVRSSSKRRRRLRAVFRILAKKSATRDSWASITGMATTEGREVSSLDRW
jgi:hypothetical protein